MDALVASDYFVKRTLSELLKPYNLQLELEPEKIWIPPGAKFYKVMDLRNIEIFVQDGYFTLLSKAIKAPEKNRFLIEEALEVVEGLGEDIKKYGGDPNRFKS